MLTGLQTTLTAEDNGCPMETVPLRFIATDDGRTLFAFTENEDGMLEIMTAPVTLMASNGASASLIKHLDGNLIVHPQPVFQISVEDVGHCDGRTEGTNEIQGTVSLVPAQTVQDNLSVVTETSMDTKAAHIQNLLPVQGEATPDKKATIREGPIFGRGEKNRYKRSPGRPKKNEIRSNQSMEPLRCDICQQEFNKQSLYRKHMESHAEEKPHRCPKCPASFNIPTNFTLHMATHNTGDPKCPECGRKFARMASLKSHMLLHEKEENLFCTECEDAFSTKAQLDAHLKLHGEKWSGEETRKCKLCNKQFTQPALYRLHIREHYRLQTKVSKQTKRGAKHKTMYKCTICLKSFQKPSQLMRHIRVHTGEKPFKCTICGRAFTQKSSLQIHTWQHNGIRPHTCDLCNAKFSQKGNLNAHILRVHNAPEGEPIYGCTYCSCVFKKFGSLNGHIKRMHSNVNEDRGDRDDENGKNESDMHATVDSVISQLVSLESVGNDNDNSTAALHEHRPTDTVNGNDILQQALKNSGLPSKNKITDDGNSETSKADSRTNFVTLLDRTPDGGTRKYLTIRQRCVGNVRWYACSFCHKEFKKPSDLIRHLRVHTQEKPFKCTHCFRSFALKSTMIAHERTHTGTKKYSCLSCDKTFACHGSLAAHNRLQHGKPSDKPEEGWPRNGTEEPSRPATTKTGSRSRPKLPAEAETIVAQLVLQEPLVITETGNRISVAQAASKQRRACDSGETSDVARPHRCWVCHASFRKVSHLKQHYRRHTGERPYRCTTCDRRFTSNSVLKSHLHTHEDARPYGCSVCGTKFSTQSSMKRHLVTHSNKRPYMCPYCHKTFKTYVNCRKHMKIHRHELAQRQLEQQQKSHEGKEVVSVLPGNLNLSETINVSFQPEISEEFTEGFTEQLECIADKNKSLIATETPSSTIVNQTLPDISTTGLAGTQMLNADETGTVTIPNYSGDQTLTPESMREIEETLNQQLFNIGMNLGLGNNLIRQIDDGATVDISGARDQRVLNVIYENNNNKNNIGSSSVFASQFDSFDMSQIALQADPGIDLGLVETTTSASMASILPRSVKEQHRFVPVTGNGEIVSPIGTTTTATTTTTTGSAVTTATIGTGETGTRTIFLKPAGSVCFQKDVDIEGHQTVLVEEANQIPEENCVATGQFQDPAEGTTGDVVVNTKETTTNDLGDTCNRTRCESLLQCHICNEQGFTAAGLKEHLKTHRGSKEYQCGECSMRFCTNGGLSRHTKVHGGRQQWRCLVCQRTLSSKSQLRVHSKCHEFSVNDRSATEPGTIIEVVVSPPAMDPDSSISEKVLLDTVAEKQVMDQKTETRKEEPREYTNRCRFCPKTFRKPSDLIRHTRTHTGERPYKCDFCSKCFAVKCTLDSHTKVHTGKKTFRCHVCSSLFATKGSLKVHMRLHTGSKPFRCTICDLRFRTSGHRKVHLLKHAREHKPGTSKRRQKHLKVAAIAEVAADLEKSTKEKELTDENIVRDTNYQNYQTIDVADTGPNLTEQISFNGDATTTTTTTTILNNNPVFSINENNQLVANLHFLFANGLVTIQTDDTVVQQPMTEQRAAETHVLVAPLQPEAVPVESQQPVHGIIQTDDQTAEHNSRKRTKAPSKRECDVCGKTFTKPYQVERHKRIHTGERPYKCDLCAKSFAQKSTLQMHQKHHTGDRPHPCPHCEYSFTQKGNLRTHVKRVHQLDTLDVRKLRRVRQTHHSYAPVKPVLPDIADTKILSFDDISFVELLK